jgi:hypothetical protein
LALNTVFNFKILSIIKIKYNRRKLKSKIKFNLFRVILTSVLMLSIYGCGDDDTPITVVGPDAKSINGTVNFVDTNFILTGGTYLISAYETSAWPTAGPPNAYDTIRVTRTNNVLNLDYNYKLVDLNPGDYVVSVGFRKSSGGQSPIMSIYGCDTLRAMYPAGAACLFSPSMKATIGSNNEGTTGINMLSWSDTTSKIY